MRTRTMSEWKYLYVTEWRHAFAHLPKEDRAKLVRGCMGKAVYDSRAEAEHVIDRLPLRPGELLGAYDCPLCGEIHTGNRKHLRWDSARQFAQIRRCNGTKSETPGKESDRAVTRTKTGTKSGAMTNHERTW